MRPNRAYRRQFSGEPCPLCNLAMHHSDIIVIHGTDEMAGKTRAVHKRCVELYEEAEGE